MKRRVLIRTIQYAHVHIQQFENQHSISHNYTFRGFKCTTFKRIDSFRLCIIIVHDVSFRLEIFDVHVNLVMKM